MGAKMSVLGLKRSFSQYLRSAMVRFPLFLPPCLYSVQQARTLADGASAGGRLATAEGTGLGWDRCRGCTLLHSALHTAHAILHCTLHMLYCTLHYSALYNTLHCTLHTAYCILHTAYYTLDALQCIGQPAHTITTHPTPCSIGLEFCLFERTDTQKNPPCGIHWLSR